MRGLTPAPPARTRGARTIRVLVAGEQAASRAGIRLALEEQGIVVCSEAEDAVTAFREALRHRPDICLLDLDMPGNALDVTAEITRKLPATAVVVLTSSLHEADFFDALRAGASGYLLKDTDPVRLPFALRGVLRGEAALPRRLAARLVEEFRDRGQRRRLPLAGGRGVELTSREWEVLELLRQGASTAEIARRLFVSQVTVRRHIGSVLKKLGASDRDAALRLLDERSDI